MGIWALMGMVFAAVCLALGAALFPAWRIWPWQVWRAWRRAGAAWPAAERWRNGPGVCPHPVPGQDQRTRWSLWVLVAVPLVAGPAVMAWWWGSHAGHRLQGYDDTTGPADARLMALLEGEHLTPPPALPPDLFLTQELVRERPLIASADRRWDQLDADFVQRILRVFKVMREQHGYEMVLLEGWRSPERQSMLASQGPQVTQAGAWQSYHQFGLAVDCAFLRDGKVVVSEREAWAMRGYQLYGEVAEQVGLTWGGRWKMMDFGHTEWRKPGVRLGSPPA